MFTLLRMGWCFVIGIPLYTRFMSLLGIFLTPRFHLPHYEVVCSAIISAVLMVKLLLPQNLHFPISMLVHFTAILIFFIGGFFRKILSYALNYSLLVIAEIITVLVISLLGWSYDPLRFSSLIMVDTLTALSYILISYLAQNLKLVIEDKISFKLKTLLIPSCVSLILCVVCMYFNAVPDAIAGYFHLFPFVLRAMNTAGLFLPLLSLIGLLHLVHNLSLSIIQTEEARFQAHKTNLELQHYQEIANKNMELRSLRHDLKNHLLTIDALGQSGEINRQHAYIAQISESFSGASMPFASGHLLIDSLLQSKAHRMKELGISVQWNLCPLPPQISISDPDLCALYGNILDNAIESCERFEHLSETEINISLTTQNEYLSLRVTNSAVNVKELLHSMHKVSQKRQDKPGIGLHNCQRIIDRYNGMLSIKQGNRDNLIETIAVLPCLPDYRHAGAAGS